MFNKRLSCDAPGQLVHTGDGTMERILVELSRMGIHPLELVDIGSALVLENCSGIVSFYPYHLSIMPHVVVLDCMVDQGEINPNFVYPPEEGDELMTGYDRERWDQILTLEKKYR